MRIALYHNLPSGGAKRTLSEAARRLATRHQLDLYTLSSADHEFCELPRSAADQHVFPFESSPLFRSPFGRLNPLLRQHDLLRLDRVSRRIAREIESRGYDVVFVNPCRLEQSPSLLTHLDRVPAVYYCHEPLRLLYEKMPLRPYDDGALRHRRVLNRFDPLPGLYQRRLRDVDSRNIRSARVVLVNSRFTAEAVERIYGIVPRVSYHGVDTDLFEPLQLFRRRQVLSVGSLTPLKGFDFLIRAMAEFPSRNAPRLVIASNFQNHPERHYLERLATEKGVELALLGRVSETELVRLYNESQVVAYSPVREPFGLVPLEAMACATPVVAVAEGGVPETVVDGETGVMTTRDPRSFARALERIVEDPVFARRCGENGRDHVLRQWTWARAVATLESHLWAAVQRCRVSDSAYACSSPPNLSSRSDY